MYNLLSCYVDTEKQYKLVLTPELQIVLTSVHPHLTSVIVCISVCPNIMVVFICNFTENKRLGPFKNNIIGTCLHHHPPSPLSPNTHVPRKNSTPSILHITLSLMMLRRYCDNIRTWTILTGTDLFQAFQTFPFSQLILL